MRNSNIKTKGIVLLLAAMLSMGGVTDSHAVTPMETDLVQRAGKFADWIQKMLVWGQDKIEEISQSNFAQSIGEGVEKAKKYRAILNSCIHQGQEKYSYTEKDLVTKQKTDKNEACPSWTKWVSYKRLKSMVLDSKAYKIFKLTERITDNAIEISRLNEQRENYVKQIKQDAEDKKVMYDEKISIAQDILNSYANRANVTIVSFDEFDGIEDAAEREAAMRKAKSKFMEAMKGVEKSDAIVSAYNDVLTLKNNRFLVDIEMVDRIAQADVSFANRVADIVRERKRDMEELELLKKSDGGDGRQQEFLKTKPLGEIINSYKNKFRKKDDANATETDRKKAIAEELRESAINSINSNNESIQSADDSANDPKNNSEISATADGESEVVSISLIANTIIEIETVKKIIEAELFQMEVEMLDIMGKGTNYVPDKSDDNTSTVVDICDYVLPENQPENYGDKLRMGVDYMKSKIANADADENDSKSQVINEVKQQVSNMSTVNEEEPDTGETMNMN